MSKLGFVLGTLLLLWVTTAASASPVMTMTIEGGKNPLEMAVGEDITLAVSISGLQPYSIFERMDFGVSGDLFTIIPTVVNAGSAIPDPIQTYAHGNQNLGAYVGTFESTLIFPEIGDGVLAVFVLHALKPGKGELSLGITPNIYDSSFENLQTSSFTATVPYSISLTLIPEPSSLALAVIGVNLLLIKKFGHRPRVA